MIGRITAIIVGVISTTGCAQMQAQQQAQATERIQAAQERKLDEIRSEIKKIAEDCKAKRLAGQVRGFVGSVQCSNPQILALFQNAKYSQMDLISLLLAKRLQLAKR